MLFAFVVALVLIGLSAYAISLGFAAASVGVIVASIASTAGTFIYSNRSKQRALREKRAALQQPPIAPELPVTSEPSED